MTSMNPDPTLLNKTTQKHVNDVSGSKQLEERRRVEQQKDGGSDSEPLVRLDENSGDDLPGTSDNIDDETEDFESIQFRYYDDSRVRMSCCCKIFNGRVKENRNETCVNNTKQNFC